MKPFIADVHTHSVLSGHAFGTVRELAFEATASNLQILGVTEHGPGILWMLPEISMAWKCFTAAKPMCSTAER